LVDAVHRALVGEQRDAGDHLTLAELHACVRDRREAGAAWEMPDHLAACSLCLEAFDILRVDDEVVPQRATARYLAMGKDLSHRRRRWFASRWSRVAGTAAAACVVVAVSYFLYITNRAVPMSVEYGMIVLKGSPLPADAASLPQGEAVDVPVVTRMVLHDGSKVDVEPGSRIALTSGMRGSVTMQLHQGQLDAQVTRQHAGQTFAVNTTLGKVTVVGTKFRVTAGKEAVEVYQSASDALEARRFAGEIDTVRILVTEGVVRVANRFEEVTLTANQEATLREGEHRIQVLDVEP
jgi:hypothetical protein